LNCSCPCEPVETVRPVVRKKRANNLFMIIICSYVVVRAGTGLLPSVDLDVEVFLQYTFQLFGGQRFVLKTRDLRYAFGF